MMTLTNSNYYTTEANRTFWSTSLFKAFDKCEASGLAIVNGEYERPLTDALLLGSYVDAYFSNDLDSFMKRDGDRVFKKNGELYAKFVHANAMIDRIEREPVLMDFLKGDKQVIQTAKMFGVDWRIKMDVYNGERIVDLKTVKDFEPIYKKGFGFVSWLEYWEYDIQGAIYQRIEQIASRREKPLPFYIVAVTKETVPDVDLIQIPQHVLDTALAIVESKIDKFDLIKLGEIEPKRCGTCDYCKLTKEIKGPRMFEPLEVNA